MRRPRDTSNCPPGVQFVRLEWIRIYRYQRLALRRVRGKREVSHLSYIYLASESSSIASTSGIRVDLNQNGIHEVQSKCVEVGYVCKAPGC